MPGAGQAGGSLPRQPTQHGAANALRPHICPPATSSSSPTRGCGPALPDQPSTSGSAARLQLTKSQVHANLSQNSRHRLKPQAGEGASRAAASVVSLGLGRRGSGRTKPRPHHPPSGSRACQPGCSRDREAAPLADAMLLSRLQCVESSANRRSPVRAEPRCPDHRGAGLPPRARDLGLLASLVSLRVGLDTRRCRETRSDLSRSLGKGQWAGHCLTCSPRTEPLWKNAEARQPRSGLAAGPMWPCSWGPMSYPDATAKEPVGNTVARSPHQALQLLPWGDSQCSWGLGSPGAKPHVPGNLLCLMRTPEDAEEI